MGTIIRRVTIYALRVSRDTDIVDINNLFLIKHYYLRLKILVLFDGYDDASFFKVSQFLYRVNNKYSDFYDSCYFTNDGRVKRAQLENIDFSRRFIPLQIVDKENLYRLFENVGKLLNEDDLHSILAGNLWESRGESGDLLNGAVKLLNEHRKGLAQIAEKPLIQLIRQMDVFSFILLCYVAYVKTDIFNMPVLQGYVYRMQQYSGAIRQLAENVVFHSKTGFGVIAFRVHEKKSAYMEMQYNIREEKQDSNFLEIVVNDFCGDEPTENIAENFVANLEDDAIKQEFRSLSPSSFFTHTDGDKIELAWEHFYQNPDHIGKHFGLKIFQAIVTSYDGFFGAESHKGYTSQVGDSVLSYKMDGQRDCMPGTRYHIVLPIESFREKNQKQDLSLDSGIGISRNIKTLLDYRTDDMIVPWINAMLYSQEEKNEQIRNLSESMRKSFEERECDIIYISVDDAEDGMGEIFAKALIIALYCVKKDVTLVLYQIASNIKKDIYTTLRIFFQNVDLEGMFLGRKNQIVMYTKEYEETVVDLTSAYNTNNINAYIAHMKCISATEEYLRQGAEGISIDKGAASYIPCDILRPVEISGKKQTLFEHYTEGILSENIQKADFGCKLEHTHMRLGSTIHIDKFYEGEILFGNKLFVSRFALLLVKDMWEKIKESDKLTLYGYGTYSETVLVQMVEMIQNYYPEKDVDYIILEREEERRGFLHKDRIRYNRLFSSKEQRVQYFRDRKVATIVLINSTLKTHVRLINLFKDENDKNMSDNDWLIQNYAVLLIGSGENNQYWELHEGKKIRLLNGKIYPAPKYFIQLPVDYQEPMRCRYCFPENPMAEIPLIEVNAASTIPNQAFGMMEDSLKDPVNIDYQWIKREEERLKCLKEEFIYAHVQRNENHFLYYFQTENIWIREQEKIRESLCHWKEQRSIENGTQYHIVVAPMHYSNAGFVELVNNVVFGGNAILLRIDFDKEYRCNAYTKFSYLRNYVDQLCSAKIGGVIAVHYVDDSIVSGRTFHRAKSLIESILEINGNKRESIEIRVFDKVFVLVDRNSAESRMQYVRHYEDFYSFVHVNISSLRNYGDSCVFCNLKKEADLLCDTASTAPIADYWEHCSEKFRLYTLEEYGEREKEDGKKSSKEDMSGTDRAFRRLFCTHMAQCVLEDKNHGNDKERAMSLILTLLNTDYAFRKKDRFEYFLSYLKCISRPFLVFKKPIKEAIFDILLLLIDATVRKKSLCDIIKETSEEKSYLSKPGLIQQFEKMDNDILNDSSLTETDRRDLVKLLMKQLTELKSNYILRMEKMDAIFAFMRGDDQKKFEEYYLSLIDRLVGASSDTNKSIWLDDQIEQAQLINVSRSYQEWVVLENTRAFRDGIEKLYIKRQLSEEFRALSDQRIDILRDQYDSHRTQRMFDDFIKRNEEDLDKYNETNNEQLCGEFSYSMKNRIKRFIWSLPELPTLNFKNIAESLEKSNQNWVQILKREKVMLDAELEASKSDAEEKKLKEKLDRFINDEADIYQYSNFYKILDRDGYMDGSKVTSEGIDLLICCTKVLHLCRNKDVGILDKVRELAVLFRVILRAQKVQFIVENSDNNYMGEWKKNIQDKYNSLVKSWNEIYQGNVKEIRIREKEHYTVIIEKTGFEDYNTEVSEATEDLLDKLKENEEELQNYIIDRQSGTVIWKLENKQRKIWVNIENSDWSLDEDGHKLKVARDMRRVMVFYQELKREIFNPENDDFINEISHINRELNIYNSNKVYTHTKDYPQVTQFDQVFRYVKGDDGKEKFLEVYPYYVLNLLADINVSKYYRNGLQKKLYGDEMTIKEPATWEDFADWFEDGKEFIYRFSEGEKVSVKLNVQEIKGETEILCRKTNKDSIRELTLLIYALILNAAERGRGKRETQEKSIHPIEHRVIVDIYSENGFLVLENERDEPVDIDQIKRSLRRVPESEEDGISLWSFNCYIKRCINSLILEKLKEIEFDLAEERGDQSKLSNLGEWIQKLTGEEFEIQPEQCERDGKCYFKVKLPVFLKKYR